MWRYCTSASGCKGSLSISMSPMQARECQLQNYYLLDKGFSEEPYLQLGGDKGSKLTVPHTLYGMPTTPSPITLRPCLLPIKTPRPGLQESAVA